MAPKIQRIEEQVAVPNFVSGQIFVQQKSLKTEIMDFQPTDIIRKKVDLSQ